MAYEPFWNWIAFGLLAVGMIGLLFAGVLWHAELPGSQSGVGFAALLSCLGVAALLAPAFLRDPCEYLITDLRVLWRRGRSVRSLERRVITYARVRWHRFASGIGTLELIRATPYGPLLRRQRLRLFDVRAPDAIYSMLSGSTPTSSVGDGGLPVVDRLGEGERVEWGGHPSGWLVGWRDILTSLCGLGVVGVALSYGLRGLGILADLDRRGLFTRSWEWVLLFFAVVMTFMLLLTIGVGLAWYGYWRARAMGRRTEYLLTDRRLVVVRGREELYVNRERIVDVVRRSAPRGLEHLFLVLDTPGSRALADSGAMRAMLPAREALLPVLYEVQDAAEVRGMLLDSVTAKFDTNESKARC